jgi:hypothetical protein
MSSRSATSAATRPYKQSTSLHLPDAAALAFQQARTHDRNRTLGGVRLLEPTTPSSQLTGAGGFLTWNVDLEAGFVTVGGVLAEIAEVGDLALNTGAALVTNGQSCIAAVVAKNVGGTVSIDKVLGAAAATGAQVAPNDAAITAVVGASWIKLAECLINRTGDTTVTQSQNNLVRPALAVNVDTGFGNF